MSDLTLEDLDQIEANLKLEIAKIQKQRAFLKNKLQEGKKLFILDKEHINYLEWASIKYKKSQSDIAREAIQDKMDSDKLWTKKKTIKSS